MTTDTVEQDDSEESSDSNSAIKVPEAFQIKVAELLKGISKEECDYLQDQCSSCMSEFYKQKDKDEFSTAEMPES